MAHQFDSAPLLCEAICKEISNIATASIHLRGEFNVAFSGGSLPAIVCPGLAPLDMSNWNIFLADERICPLDHPDSNYALLVQEFNKLKLSSMPRIIPIDPALDSAACAVDYEAKIAGKRMDLILLGMGPDAHTASLFPEHKLLNESLDDKDVQWIEDSPKPPPKRITLSLKKIKQARNVLFVCTGESKKENLKNVLEGPESVKFPASLIRNGEDRRVEWFVDKDAAQLLVSKKQ
jgi:6-phosphogluconolactonase